MIARHWPPDRKAVDNATQSNHLEAGVKKTAATLAAARARLTKVAASASEARAGLYTTAGFSCGIASAWVTWGVGAGLAGACASFLLMGVLSEKEKEAAR